MTILIAGGAGFIGTNLTKHFVTNYPSYEVVVLDDYSSSKPENLTDIQDWKNFHLYEGTITNPEIVTQIFQQHQPNIVINSTNTKNSEQAVSTFINGNYTLLANSVALDNKPQFIYLSSDIVYGDSNNPISTDKNEFKTEESLLRPKTVIAAAQAGADLITNSHYTEHELETTTIRMSNIYGPHQSTQGLLGRLIQYALNNEDMPIYQDGTHTRSWLYITDFVELVDKIIHSNPLDRAGGIFNVSGEVETTILKTVELILTMLNKPKDLISFRDDPPPFVLRRNLDSSKIRNTFEWFPQTDFKTGLEKTLEWINQNIPTN